MKDLFAYYLLDRTGSMQFIWSDTIGGLQEFMREQAEAPGNAWISLGTFDYHSGDWWTATEFVEYNPELCVEQVLEGWNARDINVAEALFDIRPRGITPLLDSIYVAVRRLEQQLADRPWFDGVVQLVIQTDGHENASCVHKLEEIKQLLEEKQQQGWEILFMGAGIDAVHEAATLGIAQSIQYDQGSVADAYRSYSASALASRAGGSDGGTNAVHNVSIEQ